jgi:hypothetical protein
MNNRCAANRQLPLWEREPTNSSPVILTNEWQKELAAALAELLLMSLSSAPGVEEELYDAE